MKAIRKLFVPAICLALVLAVAADSREMARKRKEFEKRGAIRIWAKRPFKNAYQYRTRNYTIRTNTTYDVARYIGEVMEMAHSRYREVFGCRFAHIPNLPINAYATREEYDKIAVKANFPAGVTSGFYSRENGGAIHIPYLKINRIHPKVTLFHEGTHQFVHHAIDFEVPFTLKSKLPKEQHIMVSTPIWLNEGLATYMEVAYYNGETLEIGRINKGRLLQLQKMLRSKTNPGLHEVLGRRYGQPFGSEHYAVAWGIVYYLRHNGDLNIQNRNRQKLVKYIESVKKGFYDNPMLEFSREYMVDGKLPASFQSQWNVRIAKESVARFEKIVFDRRQKLSDFESAWQEFILALDYRKPYGGTDTAEKAGQSGGDGF